MNIVKLIEESKYKQALENFDEMNVNGNWTHESFDRAMDEIIESLDSDEPETFELLNKLVRISNSLGVLITVSDEEKKLYGVYNSRSPFDKLLDHYLSLDSSKEKRVVKGVIDLIRANIRHGSFECGKLVEYHELK